MTTGYKTADGKDLDERYSKVGENYLSVETTKTVLENEITIDTEFAVPMHTVGSNKLQIFINGLFCHEGDDGVYTDVSSTSIRFNQNLKAGIEITAISYSSDDNKSDYETLIETLNKKGNVKKVNDLLPDNNGNVNIEIPTPVNADWNATSGKAQILNKPSIVLSSGGRGVLAGYESSGTSTTINANSPDANQVGSAITVSNGQTGTSWTKIVRVTAEVSVTLGSSWVWQGGEAPTIAAGGVLVCCWCGSGGIANFVSPS